MSEQWERDAPRRRSGLPMIGLALAVVAFSALLVRPGGTGDPGATGPDPRAGMLDVTPDEPRSAPRTPPAIAPTTARAPDASPVSPPRRDRAALAARWEVGAGAPPGITAIGATAWDGEDRLFTVGGRVRDPDTGRTMFLAAAAVYSVAAAAWTELPPPPLEPRADAAALWTGEELFVWGGLGASGHLGDGAVFTPSSGRWRRLPPSPLSPRAAAAAVRWPGGGVLVAGGVDGDGGPEDTAIWRPDGDVWGVGPSLPPAPEHLGRAGTLTSGPAAGSEPLLWFPSDPVETVSPLRLEAMTWRRTDPGHDGDAARPRAASLAAVAALDDGSFLGMRTSAGLAGREGRLLRLAADARRWLPLTDDVVHQVDDPVAALTGTGRYVAVGSSGRAVAFDLDAGEWLALPFGPADQQPSARRVVGLRDGVLLLTTVVGPGPPVVIHRLVIDDVMAS